MKTKIIYISGNEVFNMADIRAAFEEVRGTLGLGRDTIMFGVPVDNDDAFENTVQNLDTVSDTTNTENQSDICRPQDNTPTDKNTENIIPVIDIHEQATDVTPNTDIINDTPVDKKTTKTRKTRTRTAATNVATVAAKETDEKTSTNIPEPQATDNTEKIIPILSVLAVKQEETPAGDIDADENTTESDTAIDEAPANNTDTSVVDDVSIIDDIDIRVETDISIDDEKQNAHDTIANMITDDAPDAPVEKTLEQLLESMTPLREDVIEDTTNTSDADVVDETNDNSSMDDTVYIDMDDTDATLEQLAAEFAENQDKIPTPSKNEPHSKIGKLKNILPFKKAKRDDSGLMGDLFGWAGIAANDDDFSIPGFFTNAASKK